jgi:transcription-repair coupling factor (superfamily II helicase)
MERTGSLQPLQPLFQGLKERLEVQEEARAAVMESARPALLASLSWGPMLVIAAGPERASKLMEQLSLWLPPGVPLHLFPEPDGLPYERLAPDPTTVQERLRVLLSLCQEGTPLVVASAWALVSRTLPREAFLGACHTLRAGQKVEPSSLLSRWQGLGYERETTVEVPGTMAQRGGILDIFPPIFPHPFRLEFLGNEIESLRVFDPITQRSLGQVEEAFITPAREVLIPQGLDPEGLIASLGVEGLREGERWREELEMLLSGQWLPGFEFYSPLFNSGALLDYLPPNTLVALEEPEEIEQALKELYDKAEELRADRVERGELPPVFPAPCFPWPEIEKKMAASPRLSLLRWGEESLPFLPLPSFQGQTALMVAEVRQRLKEEYRVVVMSQQAPRLAELLWDEDILAPPLEVLKEPPAPGTLALVKGSLEGGFVYQDLALYSDVELFGFVREQREPRRRPVRRPLPLDLRPGDYVVHVDHGIARFGGLARLGSGEEEKEHLVLEYAEGDRLYVPSDQADRVGRYLDPTGVPPSLTRLGTQEWPRAKERAKKAADDLARELVELYASRQLLPGFAFAADSPWQWELETSFPYVETPDQLLAISDVKKDMEEPRPMDRLVCGDVGYGKTEVALRAAFKAVQDGKQVAVLVPTTVLAQQHFQTFSQRLAPFPVSVELLSRFRSPQEQKEVIKGLKEGKVDIVIGTHRLLQKDVAFKDLGLVAVDEEQRFGVRHKERLKQMRKEVDVLTLSATPIPRTMHMALAGVRDMSTMETPPEERLPIKTYVAERNPRLIREAILRELERGAQVFFVHNRVKTIGRVAQELRVLVPEARFAIAHGRMAKEELERVMAEFGRGEHDVLVCTTIIESGLDLPRVNTLIVDDADRLGLTQLYQLRGRVGRGVERAFAYFLYQRGKRLTPQAQRRLQTIYEATELGAGFRIALRDLEIRGAGNLLGPEQSGQIGAVGFDLYTHILSEAVEAQRSARTGLPTPPRPPAPSISLPLPAHIPPGYIPDEGLRLSIYHRLAGIEDGEEVKDMEAELLDRFGPLPAPVKNLLYLVRIKALGAKAGVESIYEGKGQVVLKFLDGIKPPTDLGREIESGPTQLRLNRRPLGKNWPQSLEGVLKKLGSLKG